MKTILVPLDGSALAEQVLPYIRRLATVLKAKVRLLRVITDDQGDQLVAEMSSKTYPVVGSLANQLQREQRAWDTLMQRAENYLAGLAIQLRETGLYVDVDVRAGSPAEQIAMVAGEHAALIAMATHGYSGLRRWRLGSVTDKVVHAATTPVFIVRGATGGPLPDPVFKHILVPLDGSDLARQALPVAVDLARIAGANIALLEVVDPMLDADQRGQPHGQAPGPQAAAVHELTNLAEQVREQVPVTVRVENGHPAEVIVDMASEDHADLIVIATHGYSGLRRWALGSIADKVLHATTTPLLLVRVSAQ